MGRRGCLPSRTAASIAAAAVGNRPSGARGLSIAFPTLHEIPQPPPLERPTVAMKPPASVPLGRRGVGDPQRRQPLGDAARPLEKEVLLDQFPPPPPPPLQLMGRLPPAQHPRRTPKIATEEEIAAENVWKLITTAPVNSLDDVLASVRAAGSLEDERVLPGLLHLCARQATEMFPRLWEALAPWRCVSDKRVAAAQLCRALPVAEALLTPEQWSEACRALHTLSSSVDLLGAVRLAHACPSLRSFVQPLACERLRDVGTGSDHEESMNVWPAEVPLVLATCGVRQGLLCLWPRMEALHAQEQFTCAQIAAIFAHCSQESTLDPDRNPVETSGLGGGAVVPALGRQVVQLFSNFICERIIDLTPEQITTFIIALTSKALPMDEFWLFLMAKRVQDSPKDYSAAQVTIIAERYSSKFLEDDEFFGALARNIIGRLGEFGLPQLASFLYSCAKLRFLHEDILLAAQPLFEDPCRVATLGGPAISTILTAASLLDWRAFRPQTCCRRLSSVPDELRAVDSVDLLMGLTLTGVYLHRAAGMRILLRQVLRRLDSEVARARRPRFHPRHVHRRVGLIGLCAAFGVPHPGAWPLSLVREVNRVYDLLCSCLGRRGADSYEPTSSSFHLEVVSVLRILDVDCELEHRQWPFCLDVAILPAQQVRADL